MYIGHFSDIASARVEQIRVTQSLRAATPNTTTHTILSQAILYNDDYMNLQELPQIMT
jgi:hypothetical protein